MDQLVIDGVGSLDEFDASVSGRKISTPKKKSVKETIPYSNITYDFSKINGEVYWDERTLEYTFEILAKTPEELERKKQKFLSWVMNVAEQEIYDPFVEGYHFVGTYEDASVDDSEIEKSVINITFLTYPYMISDEKKTYIFTIDEETVITVENNSSHRIVPTLTTDESFSLTMRDVTYSVGAGEITSEKFMFEMGINDIKVVPTVAEGTLKIEFYEEVF